MASMTMSQALVGTTIRTTSAPRRAIRSSPAASNNVTMAVFRPGFRQQRPQPQQRCGPRKACGPGIAFGAGPMGFTVNGRPMSAEDMMREAERLFQGSGWADAARNGAAAESGAMRLAVDVIETDDAFTFTTDVPGVSRQDVKVQAKKEERELTISGTRAAPAEAKSSTEGESSDAQQQANRRRRIERRFGKFSRTFKLPDNADISGITARFDNGVLTVTVKKTQQTPVDVTDIPIGM